MDGAARFGWMIGFYIVFHNHPSSLNEQIAEVLAPNEPNEPNERKSAGFSLMFPGPTRHGLLSEKNLDKQILQTKRTGQRQEIGVKSDAGYKLVMRKPFQFGVLACAVLAVLALLWARRGGARRERELDAKGSVIVTGDGTSRFGIRYREAADLISRGRISEAQSVYMDLTNKEPGSPSAYIGLGACCLHRNDVKGARLLYEAALRLAPGSVNALVGLGSSYSFESDYTNAARNYELALAVDESFAEAHWGLAIAYAKSGRRTDAINHLNRFKKLAPDSRHLAALQEIVGRAGGQ